MVKVKNPHKDFYRTQKQPDYMKLEMIKSTNGFDHVVKFKSKAGKKKLNEK